MIPFEIAVVVSAGGAEPAAGDSLPVEARRENTQSDTTAASQTVFTTPPPAGVGATASTDLSHLLGLLEKSRWLYFISVFLAGLALNLTPCVYPMLGVTGMGVGIQDLHANDQATPDRRAKPAGTAGLLLFRAVGTAAATDPSQCSFLSFVSKTEFKSHFTSADNGKTATYFARWTNSKGEVGPWSPAASMPIAA